MPYAPTSYLPYDFANRRHIGPSPAEMDAMLKVVGAASLAALIDDTLPAKIRQKRAARFWQTQIRARAVAPHEAGGQEKQRARLAHWAGLSRHGHTARDPAQHSSKTPRGTRPIRPISPKFRKVALRRF